MTYLSQEDIPGDIDTAVEQLPAAVLPFLLLLRRAYRSSSGEIEVFTGERQMTIRPSNVYGQMVITFNENGEIDDIAWDNRGMPL